MQGHKPPPKLLSSRSPAVIITLQTGAAAKGVTYAQVLERAAEKIDLGEIGLETGLKIRRSATGARLQELPKAAPEKAKKLARSLRSVLDGVADIVQSIKRVSMRVGGLYDSATSDKVNVVICRAANLRTALANRSMWARFAGATGPRDPLLPVAPST